MKGFRAAAGWRRLVLCLGLAGCAAEETGLRPVPLAQAQQEVAERCTYMGGTFIADADAKRSVGGPSGSAEVTLPGPDWCERAEPPAGAMFLRFAPAVALRTEGRMPTASELAHTLSLAAARFGPEQVPPSTLRNLAALRAALDSDLRAGMAGEETPPGRQRLLPVEQGPQLRVIEAQVGAAENGSSCIPTRIVYEERDHPSFPAGTVLRMTSTSRYCLAPANMPGFAVLRASERRFAQDPQADPRSVEWAALTERYFASLRFVPGTQPAPARLRRGR
ncbi:hypothetical protein [Neoroseomonas oryzicola]|uniref:Uncharacterized protein n=1 Tax=Neoroseomonas oryzicola TaxID=535904 RepID=A0A9X9WGQ7_9PROT|nr:hypothetical protein [Neoroseomonas oryzicola]MBR0659517.1 hypothetical protein [Neoroseomonas oryzicola]NKE16204.1 hypothetical protein [Neoroseomonas oryzicola]